ncbi:alpha/beta fold hydrolase [Ferrovibrio sp.]|uniref:alpha/beta fold hydrolase n=1 Tax=Ferrovibrio sp. TaxID=1917215 RepID=UPI00311F6E1F
MPHLLFLPGAGGAAEFWHPLGALLPADWQKTFLSWPGLGHEGHRPGFEGFDALTAWAAGHLAAHDNVVLAQSMGAIVALRLALAHPDRVNTLVLTAGSGGLDLGRFGAADWRPGYYAEYPRAARWIETEKPDHTAEMADVRQPVLLLWGDADAISPPAVGRHLQRLLPRAKLQVIAGGDHGFAKDRAAEIAPLVAAHIRTGG